MPWPLIRLKQVDSTQDFLLRHPELGFCGVLAEAQTQGRGQRGNRWESEPGAGLWLSACIPTPELPSGQVLQRAMAAVAEVLEPCGIALGLKWPNDLVARDAGRLVKLGGIIGQTKGERLILGVGVNLLRAPALPGRAIAPACVEALRQGPLPDATTLALGILEAWSDLTIQREPAFRWPAPGEDLRWETGSGRCEAWLEDGRLAIHTPTGLQTLTAGDLNSLGS